MIGVLPVFISTRDDTVGPAPGCEASQNQVEVATIEHVRGLGASARCGSAGRLERGRIRPWDRTNARAGSPGGRPGRHPEGTTAHARECW